MNQLPAQEVNAGAKTEHEISIGDTEIQKMEKRFDTVEIVTDFYLYILQTII